jgi:hypothetical protein
LVTGWLDVLQEDRIRATRFWGYGWMEQAQGCAQWQALVLLLHLCFHGLFYTSFTIADYVALHTWMIDDL